MQIPNKLIIYKAVEKADRSTRVCLFWKIVSFQSRKQGLLGGLAHSAHETRKPHDRLQHWTWDLSQNTPYGEQKQG